MLALTSVCAMWLAIQAGLSTLMAQQQAATGQFSQTAAQAALASLWVAPALPLLTVSFLFGASYALSYTPLTALVATEAMDSNTRAKGLALSTIIVNAMLFLNQFAGPIALQNITWV